MEYKVGDIVKLKKPHPCGSQEWEILRVGADFRLKCLGTEIEPELPEVEPEPHFLTDTVDDDKEVTIDWGDDDADDTRDGGDEFPEEEYVAELDDTFSEETEDTDNSED